MMTLNKSLKTLQIVSLLSAIFSLSACSSLSNEGVEGAYPVKTPMVVKGALVGGAAGAAAGGIASNPNGMGIGAGAGAALGAAYGFHKETIQGLSTSLRAQALINISAKDFKREMSFLDHD